MIYVILTYIFAPILYFLIFIKKKKSISRILVIQNAQIGDLICSTPIFRELKKQYPHAHLTVLVNPVTKELVEYNPHIDEIIAITSKNFKGLTGKIRLANLIRRGKYNIGICLNPNVPFGIALFWGLVPVRISVMPHFSGMTFKMMAPFFTYLEPHSQGQLVIETYMKMLKAIGIESLNLSKEVYKSENADIKVKQILRRFDKPLIGIAVSCGNKLKELAKGKTVKLIDMLLNNLDVQIVLIGSENDKKAASAIFNFTNKKDKVIDTTGKFTLKELPALIEKLSLFIGVDTGIIYMADALNIPIIHLAGPIDTSEQRPIGKDVIIIQEKLNCVPCTYVFKTAYICKNGSRECIEVIKIEDIIEAAKELINK